MNAPASQPMCCLSPVTASSSSPRLELRGLSKYFLNERKFEPNKQKFELIELVYRIHTLVAIFEIQDLLPVYNSFGVCSPILKRSRSGWS
jgi:hypothetical protein